MHGQVLRLFGFQPLRPALDEIIRVELMPALLALPGIVEACSARQGPGDTGPRLVVSVWESPAAMERALGAGSGAAPLEVLADTAGAEVEAIPLLVARRYLAGERPRIVRILRGRVRAGELDAYAEDVGAGSDADARRENGPIAVYMGGVADAGPGAFLTLSTWPDWAAIEAATGGDVNRPRATRRPERLVEWDVRHFEVVPDR